MPVFAGYSLKSPPGAQKDIQLEGAAGLKAVAPGIPVSPKQDQPGSLVCASTSLVAAVFAASTL